MTDPFLAGKRAAARAAADLVRDGSLIGLGTGSTFRHVLDRLAERIRDERLRIRGVPTSEATAARARELAIPLVTLDDVERLDLAIDGADEIDPALDMIKGGGGALLREKLVAAAAREMVVIVTENKLVERLGTTFPLPVEILAFGRRQTQARVAALGAEPTLRLGGDGRPFRTDNGNLVLDCRFGPIADAAALDHRLHMLPGVVDTGLFLGMAGRGFVGNADGSVRPLERR
jgi:ribose 5-phosphate isomerase A